MAARTSMSALIAMTRTLIADTAIPSVFDDGSIQDALDRHRTEQRFVPLTPAPTFQAGGAVLFLDYYANVEHWEDDVRLQDAAFTTLTPSLAEPIVGHWSFSDQPAGFAVRATGKTYDLYGAAADLLETWGARLALAYDVSNGQDRYMRSQQTTALRAMAADYRRRALATVSYPGQSEESDVIDDGPAVTYPTRSTDL